MASGSMQALVLNPKDRTVTVQDVSVPVPGPRQILIKVKAVALNPVDVMNVDNPIATQELRIVGSDFAGIVTQVGADFAGDDPRARAGARVAGFVQGANSSNDRPGAFAGYVVADYDLTWIIPAAMPFESAATVSLTALTAAQGLFYRLGFPCPFYTAPAGSQPNDEPVNVLINGAAGQVGTFAAQLARLAEGVVAKKIRLIGTASASKHALLRQEPFSYDLLVDYRDPDWVGKVDEATEGSGILYGIDAASIGSSVASVESTLCPTGKFAVYRSPAAGGFDLSGLKIKPVIGIVWEGLGVEIGYHGITFPADNEARKFAASFFEYLSQEALRGETRLHPPVVRHMPGGLVRIAEDGFSLLRGGKTQAHEDSAPHLRPLDGEKMVYSF
ncbi:hypothetical protein ACJZ2D_004468 [Fusarium nematophilum]